MESHKEKQFSTAEMARFSSGIAAYRIVRLSVELFLVVRVQELHWSVSRAGTIYLLYSLASIGAGLFFLGAPNLCFGSPLRGVAYFVVSGICMLGGFLGMFYVTSVGGMVAMAIGTGFGTAAWNVNYQTITNLSYPKSQLGSVARMRQLFESIGFLAPGICLAVVVTRGYVDASTEAIELEGTSFTVVSVSVLAVVALLFALFSSDQIITNAARIRPDNPSENTTMELWEAVRAFFGTSVARYFLLNSLLLSLSNILMGTMSLITEMIFGLDPGWLWLAAIGFPIGGMVAMSASILSKHKKNSKSVVLSGLRHLNLLWFSCVILGFTILPSAGQLAKPMVFAFGLSAGMIYSMTFAAAIELWLIRLKDCDTSFVARASVINNLAVQAVIASIFQLQTLVVDAVVETDEGEPVASAVLFGPLLGLGLICWILAQRIPFPKDPIFGWPIPFDYSTTLRCLVNVTEWIGFSKAANSMFFAYFYDFRISGFAAHLDDASVQAGPSIKDGAALNPSDLEDYLRNFDGLETDEQWFITESKLCEVILDNENALRRRLDLIQTATKNISIITWLVETSKSGEMLADALIKRAAEGIHVRVIVDAVTLYYLHEKHKLRGMNDLGTLQKLAKSGVEVRMLDAIHEEEEPSFVIGNHRKIMIVDDAWMVTGGRNNSDRYFSTIGFHYNDADVLLQGSFKDSAGALYNNLWGQAREVSAVTGKTTEPFNRLATEASPPVSVGMASIEESAKAFDDGDIIISNEEIYVSNLEDIDVESGRSPLSSIEAQHEVTIFQLDHKGGNKDGLDITFSTLLFLVETAEEKIDLVMGYLQLFPELEAAIMRAITRGVKIRVATNSDATNGLPGMNLIFHHGLERLLAMGVEVLVTPSLAESKNAKDFCLHYKLAVFDQRVALVGSWNCLGTSVFYDSDFSVVLFEKSRSKRKPFHLIEDIIDGGLKSGHLVPLLQIAKGSFQVPPYMFWFSSKLGARNIRRGF